MFQVADHKHQTGPPNVADPQPWEPEAQQREPWGRVRCVAGTLLIRIKTAAF